MEFKNGIVEMSTDIISGIPDVFEGKPFCLMSIKDNKDTNLYAISAEICKEKPDVREQVFFVLDNFDTIEVDINGAKKSAYTGISMISPYRERA